MTHTEESLMELVTGSTTDAVRLAIREVLAGYESYKEASEFKAALVHELLPYQERAVKAEAECERLRQLLIEIQFSLDHKQRAQFQDRLDAALKDQP